MDRSYDYRDRGGPDAQEIDSEQLLNLTLQTHGSGGSFFVRSSEPEQLFVSTSSPRSASTPVSYDTFSALFC